MDSPDARFWANHREHKRELVVLYQRWE